MRHRPQRREGARALSPAAGAAPPAGEGCAVARALLRLLLLREELLEARHLLLCGEVRLDGPVVELDAVQPRRSLARRLHVRKFDEALADELRRHALAARPHNDDAGHVSKVLLALFDRVLRAPWPSARRGLGRGPAGRGGARCTSAISLHSLSSPSSASESMFLMRTTRVALDMSGSGGPGAIGGAPSTPSSTPASPGTPRMPVPMQTRIVASVGTT